MLIKPFSSGRPNLLISW